MPEQPTRPPEGRALTVIGWMELIDLPDLGLCDLKTKIDTGARTSALHASDIRPFVRDGADWVHFLSDVPGQVPIDEACPVHAVRSIKNTSGVPEERFVILTRLRLGRRKWTIELSLTDRANMTFPLILGRAALKNHRIAVDTRRTYLTRPKPD